MKILKEKWGKFLGIILGPGSVIFVLLTIGSLAASFYLKKNIEASALLAVLGSVFGGVAGSFIKDDYNKISGENVLEKKGRSALRNLESIGAQLQNVRFWIADFAKRKINKEQKAVLSELDRHLSTTQMNIKSGFEDWKDIVPELVEQAEREAEITKKQQEVLQAYVKELLEQRKELVGSKDEKRVEELKKRISTLEKQIKEIRSDAARSLNISKPLLGTAYVSDSPFSLGSSVLGVGTNKCANCGKEINHHGINELGVLNVYSSYCNDCKNKLFGP